LILLILLAFAACAYAQTPAPVADKEKQKTEERLKKEQKKAEDARKKQEELQKAERERQLELEQAAAEYKKRQEEKAKKKRDKKAAAEQKAREKELKKQQQKERAEALRSSSLVIDYDLRVRAAAYSNPDYTLPKSSGNNIFQQYLSVNVIGKFDSRVEMSAKLASYGVSGKTLALFDMPYSDGSSSFFLQTGFLTFKSDPKADILYALYVGKQEITVGDGFIIDGNNNGMLGARVKADLSSLFGVDVFAARADAQDFSVYGGTLRIKVAPLIRIGVYQERNNTGFEYVKGISDPSKTIERDDKLFYVLRLLGGDTSYKYKIEVAHQGGELVRNSTDTVNYDYFAFALEGSWSGKIMNADSNAKILFTYADADLYGGFNPTFTRRYDGLQRVGYGSLFAASAADSFLNLPDGYRGINTLGFQFDTMPWSFLQAGIGWFLFSASAAPPNAGDAGFADIYGAKADLGSEFDFFVKYSYEHYFDAALGAAIYTPPSNSGAAFANTDVSYLLQLTVSSRF
ncbi:MAG: hypothetical protein FWC57_06545, partial [Endomicrobia bacterium]|nr:hypothetical protein [Endomicrobiia bacterium]